MENVRASSNAGSKGIVYQFIVALEKCFELLEGESLYIETYGDISITGQNSKQIEVKQYTDELTDMHKNFWNTLNNWLDPKFCSDNYKYLLLHTTQQFSKLATLVNWNSQSVPDRFILLTKIKKDYLKRKKKSEKIEILINKAFDDDVKLKNIISKISICSSQHRDDELVDKIKQKWIKNLKTNKEIFIQSLLGFIISPEVSSDKNKWEIKYRDFANEVARLNSELSPKSICFPKKYSSIQLSPEEYKTYQNLKFVEKIREIQLSNEIQEAINDFAKTRAFITDDISQYELNIEDIEIYEDNEFKRYNLLYKKHSLKTNNENHIEESKDFYYTVLALEPVKLKNFNNTDFFFKNGILHLLANEENENKIVVWKLEL